MFILSDDFAAVRSRFCCLNSRLPYNYVSNRIITAPFQPPNNINKRNTRMGYDQNSISGVGKGLIDSVVQIGETKAGTILEVDVISKAL